MAQTRVKDTIEKGLPGQPFGDDPHILSRVNQDGQAKQIEKVTVDSAANNTDYTITLNGVGVTYTSGGSATKTSIRDGLIQAVKDEPLVSGSVEPESDTSDSFTLTSIYPGQSFSFSESDSNLSSSQTQSAADATAFDFGRAVIPDGIDLSDQAARVAKAASLTAAKVVVDVADANGDTYYVFVEVDGQTYRAEFTSAGAGNSTLANELQSDLNGALPTEAVDVTVNGSNQLVLTAELAGKPIDEVSVDVDGGNGGSIAINSDNRGRMTDINEALVGVSAIKTLSDYPRDGADGGAQIGPNDPYDVVEGGQIVVETEDAVSEGDDVYVRLSANGSLDQLGGFRASSDTGCVELKDVSWHGKLDADLAVLSL